MRKARNDPRNQDCEVASLSPQVLSFIQARCQALLFRRSRHRVVDTEKEPGDMATLSSQSFGDLLRRHRIAAGLTQEVLADRAGLSVRGLSDLERGARLAPRRETVQLLCKALQLSEAERARLDAAARHRGISAARAQGESLSLPPGNLHASPFVGRTPELALLDHLLRDNLPGLLVAGEPGIGKSRLLQVGIERAKAQGWTVLTGGCHRRSGQEPYAPLVDALADSLRRQPPAEQQRHLQDCTWLVRLLPELAETGVVPRPPWTLPPEQERRLMFAAVARYLAHVAGRAGTLLVLDDLHWAGPDALDLLQSLVHAPADPPLRLLAAYRDTDVSDQDPLALLVADLAREGHASRVLLTSLGEDEATALLDKLLPETAGEVRQQVLERATGVPLFLVSCVQALRSGQLTQNGTLHVPWTLREAILQRVIPLQEAASQILRQAAVFGRRVPRTVLMELCARSDLAVEAVLEGLEVCMRARLLGEVSGDAYQFTHDLIREVVLSDLGAARRTLLHRRVAEVLETTIPVPAVAELAYHYARSDVQDKALLYLERAGDAARARHAHNEAASAYREVISRLQTLGRSTEAIAVCEKLGVMLARLAHYDEALVTLERAAEVYQVMGDLEGELRALAQMGRIHYWRGTSKEGLARLLPMLGRLPKTSVSRGAAAFYIALAYLYMGTGQYSEQIAAAEQAATLARSLGDEALLTTAQERRAAALLMVGRLDETCRVLTGEVIPAAEASGRVWTVLTALDTLVRAYESMGDYQQAHTYLSRPPIALAEHLDDPVTTAHKLHRRGLNAFALGQWKRARSDFEHAATLVGSTDQFLHATYPPHGLGLLCLAEGREEEAAQYLTQALRLAQRNHDLQLLCGVQSALAEWDLLAGRPESACARLDPLLSAPGPMVSFSKEALALLAWTYLELGEAEQARIVLMQVLEPVRQAQMHPALVHALRVHALLLSKEGGWEEIERALQEALLLCREMASPYAEAKVHYTAGVISNGKGELVTARQRFEAARQICTRLGERLYALRIERILSMLH